MFRQPIGNFFVGVWQLDTQVIGEGKFARKVPITIFYPSDQKGDPMPYLSGDYMRQLRESKNPVDDIDTYCYQEVSLSQKQEKYPVIVYSHGLNGYPMENTVLCADLASKGYVVFSVGHPYGANIIRYTDNTYIDGWEEQVGSNPKCSISDGLRLLCGTLPIRSCLKQEKSFERYCKKYAMVQQKLVPLWEEDLIAGMNYIEKLESGDEKTMWEHRLNLSHGFSLIGMSLGGNAVVSTCLKDSRVTKAINLDGGLFTGLSITSHMPPILVYCEKINRFAHLRLRAMGYKGLTIKKRGGISHFQFTDGVYLSDKGKKNPEWAKRMSEEKANLCLEFLQ